ncbi:putative peptidase [Calothrix sp. NIES-2100]|uniref:Calx-beta domain-containing protein n=1 Tax=Calothrix sp. NIES-2100 TaxID=1954172 RepID=UPI000B5FBC5F|nr:putative peptidase [Calothrix sp. NIES-2100]
MFDNPEVNINSSLPELDNNSLNPLQADWQGFSSQQLLSLAGETLIQAWQNEINPTNALFYAAGSIFKTNFAEVAQIAFGESFDVNKAAALGAEILSESYGVLPDVQFLSNAQMNGALGAYAKDTNTIYINSVFLAQNADNPTAIGKVLVEEEGHFLDAYANSIDSPGDEGEILAELISGNQLSAEQIIKLRAEDDTTTIFIDGHSLVVEQSTLIPTITISATDNNAGETLATQTTNPGQFTLTRTGNTASALTVNYTIAGTATNGTDYNKLTNSVTFAAGSATALINLTPIDDVAFEGNETVILSLATATNYNLGTVNTATVNIADNDKPTITISATDNNAGETLAPQTTNPGQFTLTRTGNTASALTVNYTIGGTATNGTDYNKLTNSVTFAAGSATALINLTPIDDVAFEGNETVILSLATATNYNLGTVNTATVNIADNDKPTITISATDNNAGETLAPQTTNPGQFTLTRTGNTASALTVNYTIAGTATNGTDYNKLTNSVTFAAGSATALINLTPIDDVAFEGNETVILSLATATNYNLGTAKTATVNIADNDKTTITISATDNNAGETLAAQTTNPGQFTLTRTGNTASALTVNYTIAGTATNGTDYNKLTNSVTFAAGSATALINLTPIDDVALEDGETVVLTLATSANYNLGTVNTATVNIADNDTPTITISATDSNAEEILVGQPTNPGQFTLTRIGNTASAVTVNYTIAGTAINGTDYNKLTNSVTFAAGSSTALININSIDDPEFEGNETVVLSLATGTNYKLGTLNTATVNIVDNNDKPTISISATDSDAGEILAGQPTNPGQFTLNRTGNTASVLTVNYTIAGTAINGTDYNKLTNSITFAAGSSTALINITPIDDGEFEGNETVVLNLATGTNYNLGTVNTSTVNIADNDKPTVTISATDINAGETLAGQPTNPGQFTFSRTGITTQALTVNYTVQGTATNGTDYDTLSGYVVIPVGQSSVTLPINVKDDLITEGDETIVLSLQANNSYGLGNNTEAIVRIADSNLGGNVKFDGVDDYLSISLDEPETEITHEFRFKTSDPNAGLFAVVDGDLGAGGHDRHIYLTGGNIKARLWNTEEIQSKGLYLADGNWHHVAYTIGAAIGGQKLYIDGQLVASGSKTKSDFDWQKKINIGFSNDAVNKYLNGNIDEVRIWNKTRNLDEIRGYMNHELNGNETGLIGYWKLNDATGNIAVDSSSAKRNAELRNNPTWVNPNLSLPSNLNQWNVSFINRNSSNVADYNSYDFTRPDATVKLDRFNLNSNLKFDGVDDYVNISATSFGGAVTVEAWVYVDKHQGWSRIIDLGNGANNNNIILGYVENSGKMFWETYQGANTQKLITNDIFPEKQWVHVAAVNDGQGKGYIYWNGELKASGNVFAPLNVTRSTSYIGRSNWSADAYFNGKMDDVRIWNAVRTQADIQTYLNRELNGNEAGLIRYWTLNETTGNIAVDSSINKQNGELRNNPIRITNNSVALKVNYGEGSPAANVQSDYFAMQAWTTTRLDAGKIYQVTTQSDDGTRFFLKNVANGQITNIAGDWRIRNVGESASTYFFNVAQSGDYDFYVQYYENLGGAAVNVDVKEAPTNIQFDSSQGIFIDQNSSYRAEYYNNISLSGTPTFTQNESNINHDWGLGSPATGIGADNFSVRWTGKNYFQGGLYNLISQADDGIRIFVDGVKVLDKWVDQPYIRNDSYVQISPGEHQVVVEYFEHGGNAIHNLRWERLRDLNDWQTGVLPINTFQAEYFNNRSLSGNPSFKQVEDRIYHQWGTGGPGNGVANDNFSARWTGLYNFAAGSYFFRAIADDGVRLWIDDNLVIDAWKDQGATNYGFNRFLSDGLHRIKVEYYENGADAITNVWWEQSTQTGQWNAEYFNNRDLSGNPTFTRAEGESITPIKALSNNIVSQPLYNELGSKIDYFWGVGGPGNGVGNDGFSARWAGVFQFDEGNYLFRANADDGIRIWVDDQLVVNGWKDQGFAAYGANRYLTAGQHKVKVEYYENGGDAAVKTWWEKVGATGLWTGQYFNNTDLSGTPVFTNPAEASLRYDWGSGSPGNGVNNDNFSARWIGVFNFEEDNYRFSNSVDDGMKIWIDDQLIHDTWNGRNAVNYSVDRFLTKGDHKIQVEYREFGGLAISKIWWDRIVQAPVYTPPALPAPTPVRDTYTVKPNDTLWGIAQSYYGDGSKWTQIQRADGSTYTSEQAKYLQIGAVVYIPKGTSTPALPNRISYTVQPNDTLWGIAQSFLGDGTRWTTIQRGDGSTYTSEQARYLQIGAVVYIPQANTENTASVSPVANLPSYIIKSGDTLWDIASQYMGSGAKWTSILKANGTSFTEAEARRLQIGTIVYFPPNTNTSKPVGASPVVNLPSYVIQSGDTLWDVAQRYLGNGTRWTSILKQNGTQFSDAEARQLQAGTVVYFPAGTDTSRPIVSNPSTPRINNPVDNPSVNPPIQEPISGNPGSGNPDKGYYNGDSTPYNQVANFIERAKQGYESEKPWDLDFIKKARLSGLKISLYGLANTWDSWGWDDAAQLLRHFLDNNGDTWYANAGSSVSIDELIRESGNFREILFQNAIKDAVQRSKSYIASDYSGGNLEQQWGNAVGHFDLWDDGGNWSEALGGFSYRYSAGFTKVSSNIISINVKFYVADIYDFENDSWAGWILEAINELHKAGYAKNFAVSGESREYTWLYSIDSGFLDSIGGVWNDTFV